MKTFKDLDAFKRCNARDIAWSDCFRLGGRTFVIYEYGPGIGSTSRPDYVYFVNRRTHDAIHVAYDCPTTNWVRLPHACEKDGKPHTFKKRGTMDWCTKCGRCESEKQTVRTYKLHSVELIPNMELWRDIV